MHRHYIKIHLLPSEKKSNTLTLFPKRLNYSFLKKARVDRDGRSDLVRIRRSRLILCCLAIHAARYSLSAVFSTSLLSLWISCFSDATYSRSCFRWWARVWMSGFTIFPSSHRQRGQRLEHRRDKTGRKQASEVNVWRRKLNKSSITFNQMFSQSQTRKARKKFLKSAVLKINVLVMDSATVALESHGFSRFSIIVH